ncbi:hypothetical protein D1872_302440 [compost metagenome]
MEDLSNDILTLAALVAAYVGVARSFALPDRWVHIAALLIAAVFVFVPEWLRMSLVQISVIGLSATGAYQFAKKKD